MDELLVFSVEGTAEWRRRMASEHPGDASRNLAAADLLTRLAQELRSLEGTSLHRRADAVLTNDNDGENAFDEIISTATRAVGFSRLPESGHEFLEELILELEHENAHGRQEHKPLPDQPPALEVVRTPRFPNGITIAGLRVQPIPVQKETMAFWFMEHYAPATDTYFGFGEATTTQSSAILNTSPLNTFALNQGPKIAGFGQGTFFNGGRAPELLKKTFEAGVGPALIEAVSAMFDGLWVLKPPKQPVTSYATAEDVRAAISGALDAFGARFREMTPEHGGIGHNGPSEDEPVTADEKAVVLRSVAAMRLAISSGGDPSVLDAVWSGLSGITAKLGDWAVKQVDMFFNSFTPAAGKALGEKWPYVLMVTVDVYYEGAHITDLIAMLLKLK